VWCGVCGVGVCGVVWWVVMWCGVGGEMRSPDDELVYVWLQGFPGGGEGEGVGDKLEEEVGDARGEVSTLHPQAGMPT
jgi:hypothetical protein